VSSLYDYWSAVRSQGRRTLWRQTQSKRGRCERKRVSSWVGVLIVRSRGNIEIVNLSTLFCKACDFRKLDPDRGAQGKKRFCTGATPRNDKRMRSVRNPTRQDTRALPTAGPRDRVVASSRRAPKTAGRTVGQGVAIARPRGSGRTHPDAVKSSTYYWPCEQVRPGL